MKQIFKGDNWFLKAGIVITGMVFFFIVLGWFWTPYDANLMDSDARLEPPSWNHIFGTDNFGRDIFSRVLEGAGTSFLVAICINLIGLSVGTVIGAVAGYKGGHFDTILMHICDAIMAFPSVMLALVVIAVLGSNDANVVWVLGTLFVPSYARVVRSQFVQEKNKNYVSLARLMGASPGRIIIRHILPNMRPVMLTTATVGFNNAVLAEASMSFLGVGVSANKPSLGRMLMEAQNLLIGGAPWYAGFVGLAIVLLVLGLSLLGEGLQVQGRKK